MKTEIKNGQLIITIPIEAPTMSASGKMSLVASSGGWQDLGVKVDGRALRGNLTVGFFNKAQG